MPPGAACPRCGHEELRQRPAFCLPVGTVLHGEYTVGNPLGQPGGFGITYLAWYGALEQPVAIKEYMPTDLAGRSPDSRTVKSHSLNHEANFRFGIEQFLREARTLARLSHPNIVRVRGFFQENGTAYLVMDYYTGRSLDRLLAERGGRLPEREAVGILLPILDALQYVHARDLLHRDVKPSNLYLKEDHTPILLDFGAARSALGERTQTASLVHTPGYAPFEQYLAGGDQGPWTDVYAATATLYKLLTGVVPPNALERTAKDELVPPERLVPGISPGCSQAVLAGLALQAEKRPQNAGELRKLLAAPVAAPEPRPLRTVPDDPPPASPVDQPAPGGRADQQIVRSSWSRRIGLGGLLVVVALGLGVWRPWEDQANQKTVPASTPASTPSLPIPDEVRTNGIDRLQYVWIPPGSFLMGCTPDDGECETGEKPRHPVKIVHGFWLGKTEVPTLVYRGFTTAAQKKRDMPKAPQFNPGWTKWNDPIVDVDWNDAKDFCEWGGGRLPSEAEWEYAARGGLEGGKYPWGDGSPVDRADVSNGARFNGTNPVAVSSYSAIGYGLYNMVGNVWEWCEDTWHDSYKGAPDDGSAWVTGTSSASRVIRGGSWRENLRSLRVSARGWDLAVGRYDVVGFRCARDAAP
jgi:formylglycine-generating enzyme required for sulfatase activity